MTMIKTGVLQQMMTTVVSTGAMANNHCLTYKGMLASNTSMSLEKRFIIRPSGVVSKNDIGARRILESRFSWSARDAQQQPCATAKASPKANSAGNTHNNVSILHGCNYIVFLLPNMLFGNTEFQKYSKKIITNQF